MHRFNFIHYIKFDKVLSGRHSLLVPFTPLASTQKLISLQTIILFTWLLLWIPNSMFGKRSLALPQCRHLRNHFVRKMWEINLVHVLRRVGVEKILFSHCYVHKTFQFAYDCRPLSAVWHSTPRLCLFPMTLHRNPIISIGETEKWVKQAQAANECKTPGGRRVHYTTTAK